MRASRRGSSALCTWGRAVQRTLAAAAPAAGRAAQPGGGLGRKPQTGASGSDAGGSGGGGAGSSGGPLSTLHLHYLADPDTDAAAALHLAVGRQGAWGWALGFSDTEVSTTDDRQTPPPIAAQHRSALSRSYWYQRGIAALTRSSCGNVVRQIHQIRQRDIGRGVASELGK